MTCYTGLVWKFLKNQKKRTILTIAGVILSTALITGTGTIIVSVKNQMIKSAIQSRGNYHVCFKDIDQAQARIIGNHIEVERSCRADIAGFVLLAEEEGERPRRLLRLFRCDGAALEMLQTERRLTEGRLPRQAGEMALSSRAAARMGKNCSIGSVITLPAGQRRRVTDDGVITDARYPLRDEEGSPVEEELISSGEETFLVTGLLSDDAYDSGNYCSEAVIFRDDSSPEEGDLFNLMVQLSDLGDVRTTAEKLAEAAGIGPDRIGYNNLLLNMYGRGLNLNINSAFRIFNAVVVTIILLATVAVIYNAFNIALIERIAQLGVLRCVGASPGQLRQLVFREAAVICLLGIPPGLFMGVTAMKAVFLVTDFLSDYMLFEGLEVVISPRVILTSLLTALVTVFLSALLPARRAGRIPAVEAVRSTGMFSHDDLPKNPADPGTAGGASPAGFPGLMALRNLRRNRVRFMVTLLSMVISVVLYVGFAGLLRLSSEARLMNEPDLPGFRLTSETSLRGGLCEEISALEGVEILFRYREREIPLLIPPGKLSRHYLKHVEDLPEMAGDMYAVPGCRIICYGDELFPLLEDSLVSGTLDPRVLDETGAVAVVREASFLNRRGVRSYAPATAFCPGDTLRTAGAGWISLTVGAVLDEPLYGSYNGTEGAIDLIVTEKQFARLTGTAGYGDLYIKLFPGADKTPLVRYLDELTAAEPDYSYVDVQAVADGFTRDLQAVSLFFYGFIAVIALIGSLNIVNTISTNLIVRTPELGILRAVGLDRSGLKRMVMTESLLYSLYALIIGSAGGTGLWFLLVRLTGRVRETVFTVPWREIGTAALGLTVISLLAVHIPLKRINGNPIVENIRREE